MGGERHRFPPAFFTMAEFARKICKRLHAYVRLGAYEGSILSVTPNALRLETGIGVVSVLSNTNCLQPFSLTVNATKPFTETDLTEGQAVKIEKERVTFSDSELAIDLSQATDIELSVDVMQTLFLPTDLNLRVRHVARVIEGGDGAYSLAALITGAQEDSACRTVRELLPKLHEAVYEQDIAGCRAAGAQLSGYGSGVTPDSDDLLEGYFAGYAALSMALGRSRDRVKMMTREIAAGAAEQTNEISAALLLQAGEGLLSEDMFSLLQSIFSDVPYRTVTADASRVTKSIAPSGINLLIGVCLAITNQYNPARSE